MLKHYMPLLGRRESSRSCFPQISADKKRRFPQKWVSSTIVIPVETGIQPFVIPAETGIQPINTIQPIYYYLPFNPNPEHKWIN